MSAWVRSTEQGPRVCGGMNAELVAKLTGVTDVASYIALNLENDALAIYLEMVTSDRTDAEKVRERLKEAFGESPFDAFCQLQRMRQDIWLDTAIRETENRRPLRKGPPRKCKDTVQPYAERECSTTIVRTDVVQEFRRGDVALMTVDGRETKCEDDQEIEIIVESIPIRLKVLVIRTVPEGIDVVLGMGGITQLGEVTCIGGRVRIGMIHASEGRTRTRLRPGVNVGMAMGAPEGGAAPKLDPVERAAPCTIEDEDFLAEFDGHKWETLREGVRENFDLEVERWIEEGILSPWKELVEGGILPLIAVAQPTKSRVRLVLDFRELNQFVRCHTGDEFVHVCSETLSTWHRMRGASAIVDLSVAYLQIHVAKKLWKYQLVKYKGRTYCLTRLRFGLSSAPRIMTRILKTVLEKTETMKKGTDSYLDILVDDSVVSASRVVEHLARYGLMAKEPETLEGAVLGLRLERDGTGNLMFRRGNEIPKVTDEMSKRELFSLCGKLVGHYPIAGWLRMSRGVVWCDASSIATGAVLKIGGVVVEDGAWHRKKDDYHHINVSELDTVIKGVNLALKRGMREVEIRTDPATVAGWMNSVFTAEKRVRTKGALVKRRLGILRELIDEFSMKMRVSEVPSEMNKADALTRVKKNWLNVKEEHDKEKLEVCAAGSPLRAKELHETHHLGADRSLFLARKVDSNISREEVRQTVRACARCQSIDPAPRPHLAGGT
ncbi:uncharacterized protein LOC143030423 [Oratosquilla oratoria]|uniref:uncharacterized protein LOC143030423 n=1 Tax=Oratosquilla oratoria TaxID=337810 RepID=UPI003F759D1D